jgi:hypothetical protein
MEEWVKDLLDEWCKDDAADLVHSSDEIIGCTICLHLRILRNQVILHLIKANVEENESDENPASF